MYVMSEGSGKTAYKYGTGSSKSSLFVDVISTKFSSAGPNILLFVSFLHGFTVFGCNIFCFYFEILHSIYIFF